LRTLFIAIGKAPTCTRQISCAARPAGIDLEQLVNGANHLAI
jgi:hypothetical protein